MSENERNKKGQFTPGSQVGRKGGRKAGTSTKSKAFKKIVDPHGEEILQKLLDLALSGDLKAIEKISGPYIPKDGQLAESCNKLELAGDKAERAWQLIEMYEAGNIDSPRVLALFKMYEMHATLQQHDIIVNKIDDLRNYLEGKVNK